MDHKGSRRKKSWPFARNVAPDLMSESRSVDGGEDNTRRNALYEQVIGNRWSAFEGRDAIA
jgi:hypothetical protein